mgnify:CR=1 FL=1
MKRFLQTAVLTMLLVLASAPAWALGLGQLQLKSRLGEPLLALPIIGAGDVLLEALSAAVPDPRYGSLLGSLLLFGAPTVLSGMISPYAVRLLVSELSSSGLAAGRLYFVSTLGSATGTLLTSFYLVLYLEIHTILLCLMAVSALVGVSLMVLDGRYKAQA